MDSIEDNWLQGMNFRAKRSKVRVREKIQGQKCFDRSEFLSKSFTKCYTNRDMKKNRGMKV